MGRLSLDPHMGSERGYGQEFKEKRLVKHDARSRLSAYGPQSLFSLKTYFFFFN